MEGNESVAQGRLDKLVTMCRVGFHPESYSLVPEAEILGTFSFWDGARDTELRNNAMELIIDDLRTLTGAR